MSNDVIAKQADRAWGNSFRVKTVESGRLAVDNKNCAALFYVESGLLNIRSDKYSLLVSPKMSVYVPPGLSYVVQVLGGGAAGWYVSIPENDCKPLHSDLASLRLSDSLLSICAQIVSWAKESAPVENYRGIIASLVRELEICEGPESLEVPLPHSDQLTLVAEQILRSPDDMRGLDFWSKEAGMSRRSFTRIFQQETGLSFAKWRNRVRLSTAVQKLSNGASVASIALELGYKNASAFHALFKRTFGLSPLAYIKQHAFNQEEVHAD